MSYLTARQSISALACLCAQVHAKEIDELLHWTDSLQWAVKDNILIFAGSNSLRDWRHNLKIWPAQSPTGPGQVHAGFLGLARKTWPRIKSTSLQGQRIQIVTGYSLGAAVALLVAEKLENVCVVTFASPVVGTWDWARRYPHPVIRCWVHPDWLTLPMLARRHIGFERCMVGSWNPLRNHTTTLQQDWSR